MYHDETKNFQSENIVQILIPQDLTGFKNL